MNQSYGKKKHDRGEYIFDYPIEIDKNTEKPQTNDSTNIQRPIMEEKILEIYNSQKNEFNLNKGILILDALSLCKYKEKYYLIDGQHRLAALVRLQKEGYKIPQIMCISTNVDNELELKQIFKYVNNRSPISDIYFEEICGETKRIIENVVNLLEKKFTKNLFRNSSNNPRPPHTSRNRISDSLHACNFCDALIWKKFNNIEEFIFQEILIFMDFYSKNFHQDSPNLSVCKEKECYFRLMGDEINFFQEMIAKYKEWQRLENYLPVYNQQNSNIILPNNNNLFQEEEETKRKNLNSLRIPLWELRIGKNKEIGKCYLCGNEINIKTYHISHIEAHSRGGEDKIENLQVLCQNCNLQMGNTNMYQFAYEKGYTSRNIQKI